MILFMLNLYETAMKVQRCFKLNFGLRTEYDNVVRDATPNEVKKKINIYLANCQCAFSNAWLEFISSTRLDLYTLVSGDIIDRCII